MYFLLDVSLSIKVSKLEMQLLNLDAVLSETSSMLRFKHVSSAFSKFFYNFMRFVVRGFFLPKPFHSLCKKFVRNSNVPDRALEQGTHFLYLYTNKTVNN